MFRWKALSLIVVGVTMLLTACGGGNDTNTDEEATTRARVLELAAIFAGDLVSHIPYTDEYYDCVIFVKVAPEPPASPLRDVAGRCLWTVEKQTDKTWVVTFRETWFCSDWAAQIEGYPDCNELTGFHEWEYFVDLTDNSTTQLDDRGQFAPDMSPG